MKKRFNIGIALAITSIFGFMAIISQSLLNYDIGGWVNTILFIVIGTGLTLMGSIWATVNWKNGLDSNEVSHIMLGIVGGLSIIIGLFEIPIGWFSSVSLPAADGIKVIVSIFAIAFIAIETFLVRR